MIKALFTRIKVDWGEFVDHQLYINDMKRDRRRIRRAIKSAKVKNSIDGRKYFVIRDTRGFPAAYNRTEIKWLKLQGIIPQHATHVDMDKHSLAIVTGKEVEMRQYVAVQNKKEQEG